METRNVPCSRIVPGNNDRKTFDFASLEELAASIQAHGLAQPITIRPLDGNAAYQIVAGERRFRAISTILGWEAVPAIVRELTDEQASAIMLAENTGRQDLNPIEEAFAYQARVDRFGWTLDHIAQVAGVSTDLVKRRLSLLKLVPEIRHLVANAHLPVGHAEAMAGLDANRQHIALRVFRESRNGLPLSTFRHVVSQLLEEQSQDSLFDLGNFWVEQVQSNADLPRKGKRAVTGAPNRKDLPAPTIEPRDTAATIIDRYIATLLDHGHEQEAAAIGTLYNAMVRSNYLAVPYDSVLVKGAD